MTKSELNINISINRREAEVMASLTGSFLLALTEALRIKPCQQKMPCQRYKERFKQGVDRLWKSLNTENKKKLCDGLLFYLCWRDIGQKESNLDFEAFVEAGSYLEEIRDIYDAWFAAKGKYLDSLMRITVKILRLEPLFKVEEIQACFDLIDLSYSANIGWSVYKILLEVCASARIIYNSNGAGQLEVMYLDGQEKVVIA